LQGKTGPQGPKGDKGDTGETGKGLDILGTYSSVSALQAAVTKPEQGDMYNVGTAAPYIIYMYDKELGWVNQGQLQGAKGTTFTPSVDAEGYISWTNDGGLSNPASANIRGPQGIQGETGGNGIHVGSEPPADANIEVWVDTEAEAAIIEANQLICSINNGIRVIDTGLTYSRGVVEVRKIGTLLWIIDSGVYNFTSEFTATKNRTVLEFDLPKDIANKIHNTNGVYGSTGTIAYFPALAYENTTYTSFNCQSYLKRSKVGTDSDTFQLVYTGVAACSGGGLCGFHLKMPMFLI
jgi:hypothetical protein